MRDSLWRRILSISVLFALVVGNNNMYMPAINVIAADENCVEDEISIDSPIILASEDDDNEEYILFEGTEETQLASKYSKSSLVWSIDNKGRLVIKGKGDIKKTNNKTPWYQYSDYILEATVEWSDFKDASCLFMSCENMTSVDLSKLDTSKVTDMTLMFCGCSGLTNIDLSTFDTSNVTFMEGIFERCSGLTNIDLSAFDTSKVTIMSRMFNMCSGLTSLDLSTFDTSEVRIISSLFGECSGLTSLDLSMFNTSKIISMPSMFKGCSGLTKLDLSSFDTKNVKDMTDMFKGCSSLTCLDISTFDTSNVQLLSGMFSDCSELKSIDLSIFNTSKVTNIASMFSGCSGLTSIDLSPLDTSNVTNMRGMFEGCSGLTSIDLSPLNTSNVTNMRGMFSGCSGLTSIDLSPFNTSNVTEMFNMFKDCSGLTSLDLSLFDTSKVTNMYRMFSGCSGLTSLDISRLDTSSVEDMGSLFCDCSGLTSLDLSLFDTSKVTNMNSMFSGCSGLTSLDISRLDTSSVKDMGALFHDCSGLTSLDLSLFDTSEVTSMSGMFSGCNSLINLDLSLFDTSKVTNMNSMFRGCSGLTSLDLSAFDTSNVTNMGWMFEGCSGLVSLDLSTFDMSSIKDIYHFLEGNPLLSTIHTPLHLCADVLLDGSNWQYEDGTILTHFPLHQTKSFEINRYSFDFYKITYDSCGGIFVKLPINGKLLDDTCIATNNIIKDCKYESLPIVQKEGYIFDAWYTEKDGGEKIDIERIATCDETVYAHWILPAESITITNVKDKYFIDDSLKLSYDISPANSTDTVEWSSSNEAVIDIVEGLPQIIGAGEAVLTVTTSSEKTDSLSISVSNDIVSANCIIEDEEYIYTGKEICPTILSDYSETLFTNPDNYVISYSNNINAGNASIVIEGKGRYTGIKEISFKINQKDIKLCKVNIDLSDEFCTGSAITKTVNVVDDSNSLEIDKDYYVDYLNNINAGKATVNIYGKGNYTGLISREFNIAKKAQNLSVNEFQSKMCIDTMQAIIVSDFVGALSYKSNNENVATIDDKGIIKTIQPGLATIVIVADGNEEYATIEKRIGLTVVSHNWNSIYTIDVEPTAENAGLKSIHCKECDKVKDGSEVAIKYVDVEPTPEPTPEPTVVPTATPTTEPIPTAEPTPTVEPTMTPSSEPTPSIYIKLIAVGQKYDVSEFFGDVDGITKYIVTSEDGGRAAVTKKGILSAKNAGTVIVTPLVKDGKQYVPADVAPVKIIISKVSFTNKCSGSYIGQIIDASSLLTGVPTNGNKIEWMQPKNDKVYSINKDTGIITVNGKGTAKVIVSITNDQGKSIKVSTTLTVKIPKLSVKDLFKLKRGNAKKITLKNVPKGVTVKWTVDKKDTVDIIENGSSCVVYGKEQGCAKVTAICEGQEYSTVVTVQ